MDWRYIAGFFDGEGSVTKNLSGFRITIPQTHRVILESIQSFTGIGSVTKQVKRRSHWHESWTYAISRQEHVYFFLKHVQPHIVVKKDKVTKVLRRLPRIIQKQRHRRARTKNYGQQISNLRNRGLTYRAIGKTLGIDWGYVRRIFLRSAGSK